MKARTMVIAMAGLRLGFIIRDAAMADRIGRRYAGWLVKKGKPAIRFTCNFSARRRFARSAAPHVTLLPSGDRRMVRSDFDCVLTGNSGTVRLWRSIYSFDALLRVLIGTLLPPRGGLVLHASALADRWNHGFVFAGRSGSGKTTVARLLKKQIVLNDEICAVTAGRRPDVSGTPFWGEMGTGPAHNRRYSLAALYFLAKAPSTELIRLPPEEALRRLLACVCFFSRAARDFEPVLKTAAAIMGRVPAYELRFRRDSEEVEATAISGKDLP
jgi:hypothetical protein